MPPRLPPITCAESSGRKKTPKQSSRALLLSPMMHPLDSRYFSILLGILSWICAIGSVQHVSAYSLKEFLQSMVERNGTADANIASADRGWTLNTGSLTQQQQQQQQPNNDSTTAAPTPITKTYGELFFHNDAKKLNRTLKSYFKAMDRDRDGSLTLVEFTQAANDTAREWISQVEKDHDVVVRNETSMLNLLLEHGDHGLSKSFEALDGNKDQSVTLAEYLGESQKLFTLPITLQPHICDQVKFRIAVCPDIDQFQSRVMDGGDVSVPLRELQWLEDAQCRTGMASLSGYRFQNCILQSTCGQLADCFTSSSVLVTEGT